MRIILGFGVYVLSWCAKGRFIGFIMPAIYTVDSTFSIQEVIAVDKGDYSLGVKVLTSKQFDAKDKLDAQRLSCPID